MTQAAANGGRRIPQRYWQDQQWAFDHYPQLLKRYKNRWVAVVDRQVVAASKSSVKAQLHAQTKTGRHLPIAVIYVETGKKIYSEGIIATA